MAIGILGLLGAITYLKAEKEWDSIIFIGIFLNSLFLGISLLLSLVPLALGYPFAGILTQIPASLSLPIPFWGILMSFIWGMIEFFIGVLVVPLIDWLRKLKW